MKVEVPSDCNRYMCSKFCLTEQLEQAMESRQAKVAPPSLPLGLGWGWMKNPGKPRWIPIYMKSVAVVHCVEHDALDNWEVIE